MKRILRRVKMNLTKQTGRLALKCVVFFLFFTMLFTSVYIDKVSKQLENNILSNYDIYTEINKIEKNKFQMNLNEHLENVHTFIGIYNELSQNENVSYSDLNIINGDGSPINFVYYDDGNLIYLDQFYNRTKETKISNYQESEYNCSLSKNNCSYRLYNKLIGVDASTPLDFHFERAQLLRGNFFTPKQLENGEAVCILPLGLFEYRVENGEAIKKPISQLNEEIIISILYRNKDGVHYYKPYKFKVIGYYTKGDVDEQNIYIPSKKIIEINKEAINAAKETFPSFYTEESGYIHIAGLTYNADSAIYKFENIDNLRSFLNMLDKYQDYFPDKYSYYSSVDETYASISNVLAVSKTIKYIAIICLTVCIVISILILLLDINSRRKEIGILLSMGETLINVIKQFTLELLLISSIAGIGSYFATDKLSDICVDYLIHSQMNTEQINSFLPEDYKVDKESILRVMEPIPLSESLDTISIYFVVVFVVEIGFMYFIIKRIDPKELLKDE